DHPDPSPRPHPTRRSSDLHYATADSFTDHGKDKVQAQSDFFEGLLGQLDYSALGYTPLFHQSNSALSLWYPEKTLDVARLGLGLDRKSTSLNSSHVTTSYA